MSDASYMEKLLEGVEVKWKPLGEVLISNTGGGTPSKAKAEYWNGEIPWASVGDLSIESHFINKTRNHITTEGLKDSSSNLISKGDVIVAVKISPGKMKVAGADIAINQDLRGLKLKDEISAKFLNYYFQTLTFQGNGAIVKAITSKDIEKTQIPIPSPNNQEKSLEIQAEIVRILDAFTELTTELTARKKQYNYYRDQLLSFEEGEVEWKMLRNVAEYSKIRIGFDKLDETNYVGVDNLLQNRAGKRKSNHVPTEGNLTGYCVNDILIGNIRPYLKKIWHADRVGGTNGDVLVIHPTDETVIPRYLYQVLADERFFDYNMQHAKGAKMPRGNKPKIMEYRFPTPFLDDPKKSLAEQARIVAILDKFDALTNSISEGLPREIELRQKQYEYYRDLLLSFPKAEASTTSHT